MNDDTGSKIRKLNRTESEENFSKYLVSETFKLIEARCPDTDSVRSHANKYLARFIGILVYEALKSSPKRKGMSKEAIYKQISEEFGATKLDIQEAVALGFQGALTSFSGVQVEYYCQINPVPQPTNEYPC